MSGPIEGCVCCGSPVLARVPDPWQGRMDDYCERCCLVRCDAYPGECSPTSPASSEGLSEVVERLAAVIDDLDSIEADAYRIGEPLVRELAQGTSKRLVPILGALQPLVPVFDTFEPAEPTDEVGPWDE